MAAIFGQLPANFRFSGALLITIQLFLDKIRIIWIQISLYNPLYENFFIEPSRGWFRRYVHLSVPPPPPQKLQK